MRLMILDLVEGKGTNQRVLISFRPRHFGDLPADADAQADRRQGTPDGFVFDAFGRLYVGMWSGGVVNVIEVPSGKLLATYDAGGAKRPTPTSSAATCTSQSPPRRPSSSCRSGSAAGLQPGVRLLSGDRPAGRLDLPSSFVAEYAPELPLRFHGHGRLTALATLNRPADELAPTRSVGSYYKRQAIVDLLRLVNFGRTFSDDNFLKP